MWYRCQRVANLYEAPTGDGLATQAQAGRWLYREPGQPEPNQGERLRVTLAEDDYSGWVDREDWFAIQPTQELYTPPQLNRAAILPRLPLVLSFALQAMGQPHQYLWGGTVEPDFDCSGLVQTAFAQAGIWLPRDAYQQETFVSPIGREILMPGDLVFFGTPQRATHVGIYLGNQQYIHCSGIAQGRNGIGVDSLGDDRGTIGETYAQQWRGAGRVVSSYQPQGI
ncbi:NLP/P60 protein [Gloeomargarita lithophora Alchichica-D10]|uniref:NLP/P60 protein n=1 Tax=Gloeomargarita lithophora Alchichica-D10 TaxID=1188229 RepID=A0A1J0AF55_9CYAN|nr:C40 family peptidase [Gloeomargarita lithophora]APB34552.1 NLP/P60 protein [Gloeomargarita lithophora Alchichica-D10]